MAELSSIGPWLRGLRGGEARAMKEIWDRFFNALVNAADARLQAIAQGAADGEDIASCVLASLWRGYQAGRFRDVTNRSELWWTLLAMTRQKCIDVARRESAEKRGGDKRDVSLFQSCGDECELFASLTSNEPDPQFLAMLEEQIQRGFGILRDATQRRIAALTVEGYTVSEIAEIVELSKSSVRRKLKIIQAAWKSEDEHESEQTQSGIGSRLSS